PTAAINIQKTAEETCNGLIFTKEKISLQMPGNAYSIAPISPNNRVESNKNNPRIRKGFAWFLLECKRSIDVFFKGCWICISGCIGIIKESDKCVYFVGCQVEVRHDICSVFQKSFNVF